MKFFFFKCKSSARGFKANKSVILQPCLRKNQQFFFSRNLDEMQHTRNPLKQREKHLLTGEQPREIHRKPQKSRCLQDRGEAHEGTYQATRDLLFQKNNESCKTVARMAQENGRSHILESSASASQPHRGIIGFLFSSLQNTAN